MSPVKVKGKKGAKHPSGRPQPAPAFSYRITPGVWLRMMKTLDTLAGGRAARTFRASMWILGILLTVHIVFLTVLVMGPGLAGTSEKAGSILELLLNLFTVAFTGVTALQIYLMKDIDHQEMSHQVFQDNQDCRKAAGDAKYQLELLAEELKQFIASDPAGFNSVYVNDSYKDLRAFAFHYEYIGHLVYRNRLNFGITFDTITFPDWLITSADAKVVVDEGKAAYSDFWLGACHLYLTYEVRRKYNNLYFTRRELPRDKDRIRASRKAFKKACRDWKTHYRQMPPK